MIIFNNLYATTKCIFCKWSESVCSFLWT